MSLQIISGFLGYDLESILVKKAINWIELNKKNEVIYLVPNYIKFEKEISILEKIKKFTHYNKLDFISVNRIKIFSFYRLNWYFFQYKFNYKFKILSESVSIMILNKILSFNNIKLNFFKFKKYNNNLFIYELYKLYLKISNGNIDLYNDIFIKFFKNKEKIDNNFKLKIKDLFIIFSEFEKEINKFYIKPFEIFNLLINYLKKINLKKYLFIIDGFENFTAKEFKLINIFLKKSSDLKISLILDNKSIKENYFLNSNIIYKKIYKMAKFDKVNILCDIIENNNCLIKNNNILKILKFCIYFYNKKISNIKIDYDKNIQFWVSENIKEEIYFVAREIRRLIIEEKYRFFDIKIIVKDFYLYENLFKFIFDIYEIPFYFNIENYFVDKHIFIKFIKYLFKLHFDSYKINDIINFLDLDLFMPIFYKNFSIKEFKKFKKNYKIQINIIKKLIFNNKIFEKILFSKKYEIINLKIISDICKKNNYCELYIILLFKEIKNYIKKIKSFFKNLVKSKIISDALKNLYKFLIDIGIEKQLIFYINEEILIGNLDNSEKHKYIWNNFIDFLDNFFIIYGKMKFNLKNFFYLLISGLNNLKFNKLPSVIDSVSINNLNLIYPCMSKIIFAIGLNNEKLYLNKENILTNEEIIFLNKKFLNDNKFILNDNIKDINKEYIFICKLFSTAMYKIYISYFKFNNYNYENDFLSYIKIIIKKFKFKIYLKRKLLINDNKKYFIKNYFETYYSIIGIFMEIFSQENNIKYFKDNFLKIIYPYILLKNKKKKIKNFFLNLNNKNISEKINKKLINKLLYINNKIYFSSSQIVTYSQCQYKFFLNYFLNLDILNNIELEISNIQIGIFFHSVLEMIFSKIILYKYNILNLNNIKFLKIINKCIDYILNKNKFLNFKISDKNKYISYQLCKIIKKISFLIKQFYKKYNIKIFQIELIFNNFIMDSFDNKLINILFYKNKKKKMYINGKIDCLGFIYIKKVNYILIIDYKLGYKKFDLLKFYYGLEVQLINYLDFSLNNFLKLKNYNFNIGGCLYFCIYPFSFNYKIFKYDKKNLKITGFFMKNDNRLFNEIIKNCDNKIIFEKNFFYKLLVYNKKRNLKIINSILNGNFDIKPVLFKNQIICNYCKFKSICKFDIIFKENNYLFLNEKINVKKNIEKDIIL